MMSEVFGWFGDAARGILSIFPQRRIVKAGYGAIRYGPRGGFEVLEAGWYLLWPLIQEFEDFPVGNQTADVPKQFAQTLDGVSVSFGGVIRYRINDIERFAVKNINSFDDIDDVAQIAMRDQVCSKSLEILRRERMRLDGELKTAANKRLKSYGVRVIDLCMKGPAPAQLIHVISDSQQPVMIQQTKEDNQ